jgi:hypothetical protein
MEEAMGLKYLFTIDCANLVSEYAGELPAGSRVHVRYGAGTLKTVQAEYEPAWIQPLSRLEKLSDDQKAALAELGSQQTPDLRVAKLAELSQRLPDAAKRIWAGIEGTVVRGIDWALVRKDGVVTFDGRVTLKATEPPNAGNPDGFLIDALISGAVDLDPTAPATADAAAAIYNSWKTGTLNPHVINVALGVRFEASGAPPADASADYQRKTKSFPRYMRLTRRQCLGAGTLTLGQGTPASPIQKLQLKVYEYDFGS